MRNDCSFENFMVDESNRFAVVVSKEFSKPHSFLNPLFLYGPSGVGKTHLLNAIALRAAELDPSAEIRFFSAEELYLSCVCAKASGGTRSWHKQLDQADVLLIDNFEALARNQYAQKTLAAEINRLVKKHKRVALASSAAPKQLPVLNEWLKFGFETAVAADILENRRDTTWKTEHI